MARTVAGVIHKAVMDEREPRVSFPCGSVERTSRSGCLRPRAGAGRRGVKLTYNYSSITHPKLPLSGTLAAIRVPGGQ